MRFILLALGVLLLPVSITGEHLYTDLGGSSMTGYLGRDAPCVYDNPAACGNSSMAGALYFEKYGFSELACSLAFFQARWRQSVIGVYALETGGDLWKESTYVFYAVHSWKQRLYWGGAVKYLTTQGEEERFQGFSYDFGAVWYGGILNLGLSVKDAGQPVLGDEVIHTVIASALCRRGDFALSMKHVSLYSRYAYTVAGMHWFPRSNIRLSYGVNNGNDEHRFALSVRSGLVSAELAYSLHPVLKGYTAAGVMLWF